jgi:amino acid adenylation domain-containing protein
VPPLNLATDHPRPKIWTLHGASITHFVPPALFDALDGLARSTGSTMFMTLFAGFAALLQRLSGQTDIVVGVPVSNRRHRALEGLMGNFLNTLVLRVDLSGDPPFLELLGRVRETALEAFANPDVSFDLLVQETRARTTDVSRAPLIQVAFNVPNTPMQEVRLDGLRWERFDVGTEGAQFELTFAVDTEARSLSVEYNTDLFARETIERYIGQYLALLAAAAVAPATPLARLPLLPAQQRDTLRAWNATEVALPAGETFLRRFDAQVQRSPGAAAVAFEGSSLSYAELNGQAARIARALAAAGAAPGARVALCMPRSPLLLASLIAVQRTGAAYVPLDPEFPPERLAYMLTDSGATLLAVEGAAPSPLAPPAGVLLIDVAQALAGGPAEALPGGPRPADAAYVLYTSGSTGWPKGVVVSHGALANFLLSMRERPGLTAADVLAAVTTVSFDIAALELYLPLTVGARIELVSRRTAMDGLELARLLDERGVTLLQATPATWRLLLEAGWRGTPRLRALCGGEALSRRLADELLERVGELWNMYGPTETTIWSTLERVEKGDAAISIGRPIANTQVHIVDGAGELAPIGVMGEICIGGAGVAQGYHRRSGLTAERFIADAHGSRPGSRLYRTGDLGRWGADGRLYHLGRADTQVKIRGLRIELGEIENTLSAHEAVHSAVAAVRELGPEEPRLVAYVTYREGEDVPMGDIKRFLRRRLPDYMIPSIVVPLPAMPLTPAGKIDRAALPDPFAASPEGSAEHRPPATPMEQLLAQIWQSVLKVERVDALANFFEAGGYSLLALQVVRMVEARTGRRMDPRTLFFCSLRELAGMLDSAEGGARG